MRRKYQLNILNFLHNFRWTNAHARCGVQTYINFFFRSNNRKEEALPIGNSLICLLMSCSWQNSRTIQLIFEWVTNTTNWSQRERKLGYRKFFPRYEYCFGAAKVAHLSWMTDESFLVVRDSESVGNKEVTEEDTFLLSFFFGCGCCSLPCKIASTVSSITEDTWKGMWKAAVIYLDWVMFPACSIINRKGDSIEC